MLEMQHDAGNVIRSPLESTKSEMHSMLELCTKSEICTKPKTCSKSEIHWMPEMQHMAVK